MKRLELDEENIRAALERCRGFVHRTARELGVARLTLVRRLRESPNLAAEAAALRARAGYHRGRPHVSHYSLDTKSIDTNNNYLLSSEAGVETDLGRAGMMFNKPVFDRRRQQKGLSLDRLARAADISVSYAVQIGHGFVPSLAIRERVAAALGASPSEFWRPIADAPEAA